MGTRSNIIVQRTDGKWHSVYCHWDGYLSHNGKILFEHYNSQKLAEGLVKLGDISSLGPKNTKPKGHTFETRVDGYTVYYGRDRKEKNVDGKIGDSLSAVYPDTEDTWIEFIYVWKADEAKWFVGSADEGTQSLIPLEDALNGAEINVPIKVFGAVVGTHEAGS
jgi:hypothetical protein